MIQNYRIRWSALTAVWIATGLVLSTGCQSLIRWPLGHDDPRRQLSPDEGPARNHQPKPVESLIPMADAAPAGIPADPADSVSAAVRPGAGIDMEDVGLAPQNVHVESSTPPDGMVPQESGQLPEFLETAVHPFGHLTPPTVSPEAFQTSRPAPVPDNQTDREPPSAVGLSDTQDSAPPQTANPVAELAGTVQTPAVAGAPPAEAAAPAGPPSDPSVIKLVVQSRPDEAPRLPGALNQMLSRPQPGEAAAGQGGVSMTLGDQPLPPSAPVPDPGAPRVPSAGIIAPSVEADPAIQTVGGQTATSAPAAIPDSQHQPLQLTWQEHLRASMESLDQLLENPEADDSVATTRVRRYLLQLVAGSADPESFEISGLSESEQEYWQQQLKSVQVMLNGLPDEDPAAPSQLVRRRRATAAVQHLEIAANQLARQASLQINNPAFCSQVLGFGQITPSGGEFVANQSVLIYCEIDNYDLRPAAQAGDGEFVAELRGQYVVVNDQNRVVHQHQFQAVQDTTRVRRKDFYMYFPVVIPELPAGHYRLQLSVEDLVGKKFGSAHPDLDFVVIDGAAASRPARTAAPVSVGGNRR